MSTLRAVLKTSVYLPDELKHALSALSERSGRREADLIRTAIEQLIDGASRPALEGPLERIPAPSGARLIGVGVGPGEPGLLTLRAVRVLRSAGRVYAPTTSEQTLGRAEMLVRSAVPELRVRRLVLAVDGTLQARQRRLAQAADELAAALDGGEPVAFLTLGDPTLYSTFPALARLVSAKRPSVPIEMVPGITSMQAIASAAGCCLAEDDEVLTVIPNGASIDAVDAALSTGQPLAIYRGGGALPALAEVFRRRNRLDQAVVGEMMGPAGANVEKVSEAAGQPASYLSSVLVPGRRPGGPK
jgi:precorrin-2/cobalt-factor-2 C20-methyltransferase